MAKVLIATPCFDGTVRDEYLLSLLQLREQIDFDLFLIPGIHFVDTARDVAAAKFLASDAEYLFFIDADLGWDASAVIRMIESGKDVIGGAYRIKHDLELYPTYSADNGTVIGLPGGFLCIKRNVIEALSGIVPHYSFVVGNGFIDVPAIFARSLIDGRMISEDMMFCRRAMSAGFTLTLDADIDLRHIGTKAWAGNYQKHLAQKDHACSQS